MDTVREHAEVKRQEKVKKNQDDQARLAAASEDRTADPRADLFGIPIEVREDFPKNAIALERDGVFVGGIVSGDYVGPLCGFALYGEPALCTCGKCAATTEKGRDEC